MKNLLATVFVLFLVIFGCATQNQVSMQSEPSGGSVVMESSSEEETASREDVIAESKPAIPENATVTVLELKVLAGVSKETADALTDHIRNELSKSYQVLSLGDKSHTDLLLAGSVFKIADTYSITLRLIKARGEDVGMVKRVSGECTSESELINTAEEVARKLAGGF